MLDTDGEVKNLETDIKNQDVIKDILAHLAPLNRHIMSDELEESLSYLNKFIDLKVCQYKTGTKCWTWDVPPKWRIQDGYIKYKGKIIVSFKDQPLHVMSYSVAVDKDIKGEELLNHIHVHKEITQAIPYEFSFYVPNWGFCLTHEQRNTIKKDETYDEIVNSILDTKDYSENQ